jgi:hypothetical protein
MVPARQVLEKEPISISTLHKLWQTRATWISDKDTVRLFFQRAFDQGELLLTYDAARGAVKEHFFTDLWLRQHMTLALASG